MKIKIPPPVQTAIAMLGMYALDYAMTADTTRINVNILFIVALCLLAGVFLVSALINFRKLKTTINPLQPERATTLAVNGIYKYSRNPMYVGLALLLFSWLLWLGNPYNLILFFAFIIVMNHIQIKPEEEALKVLFGESFNEYCKSVRRWL